MALCAVHESQNPKHRFFAGTSYYEIALLTGGLSVLALTWGGENAVGVWTYAVLWVSRLSAKLNVFLGARNLSEEFLPANLRYLQTYFRRRTMNPLFPCSLIVLTLAVTAVWWRVAGATAEDVVGLVLVATLLTLALVEHVFLMMPMPSTPLWQWAMHGRNARAVQAPLPHETH